VSRDIFVQDIPRDVQSVQEIPDDWVPDALPFAASDVIAAVHELAPAADFSTPTWGHVVLPDVDVEVSLPDEVPLQSFALHVRATDAAADDFIDALLTRLKVRAFDPEGAPVSGIFGNG
jgi:hypothetical protein